MKIYRNICVGVFTVIASIEYLFYTVHEIFLKVIIHIYSTVYLTLSLGICTIIIFAVMTRLKRIHTVCKMLLNIHGDYQNLSITKVHTINKHEEIETIGKLYEIYSMCIDLCDLINICFMFQVMMGYGFVFFNTIFISFTVYKDYATYGYLMPETTSALAFCLFYNFFLILIIFMCYQAEQEVRK